MVGLFRGAEDRLGIAPDRFIRTTDPDHVRAAQEMVRRAYRNGDIYLGTYEGWYCPNEGFRNVSDLHRGRARASTARTTPTSPLQWLTERNWFFRLSAYQERLERHYAEHPDWVQPDYRRNEMLGFIRQGLEDFSISREKRRRLGHPVPHRRERRDAPQREDGSWDPEAGTIYVWYDALINYITGRRLPRTTRTRSNAGGRPTCTSSARTSPASTPSTGRPCSGAPASRRRATSGSTAGCSSQGERMSKSRGNFFDPNAMVDALGTDGTRYVAPARGRLRPRRGRELGLLPAALQRGPGQRLREPRQPDGDHGPPLPRRRAAGAAPGRRRPAGRGLVRHARGATAPRSRAAASTRRWPSSPSSSAAPTGRSTPSSPGSWPRPRRPAMPRPRSASAACSAISSRPAGCSALVVAPFMPNAAPRVLAQLGYAYPYAADGNGGPPLLDELAWGAHADGDRPARRAGAALPAPRPRRRAGLTPFPAGRADAYDAPVNCRVLRPGPRARARASARPAARRPSAPARRAARRCPPMPASARPAGPPPRRWGSGRDDTAVAGRLDPARLRGRRHRPRSRVGSARSPRWSSPTWSASPASTSRPTRSSCRRSSAAPSTA